MGKAFWSSQAELELEEIAFYIAIVAERPAAADNMVRDVRKLCDLIATQPEMGEPRNELGEGNRIFAFKRWKIVYRPVNDGIKVMRFVDAARDFNVLE